MTSNKKFSLILVLVLICAMFGFGRYYFRVFSNELENFSSRDKNILEEYNREIIKKLQKEPNINSWQKIVDTYDEDVVIHIENTNGDIISKTNNKEWSKLDVKVQNAFIYQDNAYLIRSSVYLFHDFLTDSDYVFRIIFLTLMILLIGVALIIVLLYFFMLRPVYAIYDNIERYEKGQPVKRTRRRTEIAKLQNRFVDMTETITKQQQNQRRIIASISHDIKTPLTSIMGYTEMLKKDNITPERREIYMNTVYQRSVDIKGLIDDFDEYLSYNMDTPMKKEIISISKMMEKVTSPYYDELLPLGVKLINNVKGDEYVQVDMQKMKRVFGNLMGNSLKHFDKDEKIIEITESIENNNVVIRFSDNGKGVEDDKLDVIFEPLYTSDQGRKVAGLGLAICKEIIESHDAEIYAERSKSGGLSIVIKFKMEKQRPTK